MITEEQFITFKEVLKEALAQQEANTLHHSGMIFLLPIVNLLAVNSGLALKLAVSDFRDPNGPVNLKDPDSEEEDSSEDSEDSEEDSSSW